MIMFMYLFTRVHLIFVLVRVTAATKKYTITFKLDDTEVTKSQT